MTYLEFEKKICGGLDRFWRNEPDPIVKEEMRRNILDLRIKCRDMWLTMGNTIPSHIGFSRK